MLGGITERFGDEFGENAGENAGEDSWAVGRSPGGQRRSLRLLKDAGIRLGVVVDEAQGLEDVARAGAGNV